MGESVFYIKPWQGMNSIWSAKQFVPNRVRAGKQPAGNAPQRVLALGLELAAWGGSGDLSPSITGVAVTPQTPTTCSGAWDSLRVLLKMCMNSLESHYCYKWTNQLVQYFLGSSVERRSLLKQFC